MNRETFMKDLEYLLQDIPDEEKADALNYYADYLAEAGPENEEKVLKEFGSPERIASIIRADLKGDLESGGGFTERGYEDDRFRQPNFQLAHREAEEESFSLPPNSDSMDKNSQEKKRSVWKVLGVIALVLVAVPLLPLVFGLGLGAIGGILGLAVGVLALLAALFFAAAIWTGAWLIAGVFVVIAGCIVMATPFNLMNGVWCIGMGIVFLGVGLVSLAVSVLFYGKFLPWLVKKIGTVSGRLFHWKRRTV